MHVKHVALGVVTEQQLQGGHGGKVAGVLQEDDDHASGSLSVMLRCAC